MSANNIFTFRRTALLLRSELAVKLRSIREFTVATAACLFLYNLLFVGSFVGEFHYQFFALLLFFGGFIVSSHVFSDLHDKKQGIVFLSLPASHLEKLFVRWLLISIGYAFGLLLIFLLVFVVTQLCMALFHFNINYLRDFYFPWRAIFSSVQYYLFLQPIFLLGAVYFRKSVLAKTIWCLCGFGLVLFLLKILLFGLFFPYYSGLMLMQFFTWHCCGIVVANIILALLMFCYLLVVYFRLQESQI